MRDFGLFRLLHFLLLLVVCRHANGKDLGRKETRSKRAVYFEGTFLGWSTQNGDERNLEEETDFGEDLEPNGDNRRSSRCRRGLDGPCLSLVEGKNLRSLGVTSTQPWLASRSGRPPLPIVNADKLPQPRMRCLGLVMRRNMDDPSQLTFSIGPKADLSQTLRVLVDYKAELLRKRLDRNDVDVALNVPRVKHMIEDLDRDLPHLLGSNRYFVTVLPRSKYALERKKWPSFTERTVYFPLEDHFRYKDPEGDCEDSFTGLDGNFTIKLSDEMQTYLRQKDRKLQSVKVRLYAYKPDQPDVVAPVCKALYHLGKEKVPKSDANVYLRRYLHLKYQFGRRGSHERSRYEG